MATLFLGMMLQAARVEDLVRELGDAEVEARARAESEILRRWREWSAEDLMKIDLAARNTDPEVANRAGSLARTIRFKRAIPAIVWKHVPEAAEDLARGKNGTASLMESLLYHTWCDRKARTKDLVEFAYGIVADEGEALEPIRKQPAAFQELHSAAQGILKRVLPRKAPQDAAGLRTWWKSHQDKPEEEWYLPDLRDPDERIRAHAAEILLRIGGTELRPRLFEITRSLRDPQAFATALAGCWDFPAEDLKREFSGFLGDPNLDRRLAVVALLTPHAPVPAFEAAVSGFEMGSPGQQETAVLEQADLIIELLESLKPAGGEPWLRATSRLLRSPLFLLKAEALSAVALADGKGAEEQLLEALRDGSRFPGSLTYGPLSDPRACDIAAFELARKRPLPKPLEWTDDDLRNDANLTAVWEMFRGKTAPPLELPWRVRVAARELETVLPLLLSGDADRRRGLKTLSALGVGAMGPLEEAIRREPRLRGVLGNLSGTLRSLGHNDHAAVWAKPFRERMHEPFDLEEIWPKILEPWYQNNAAAELWVKIERGVGGQGFALTLWTRPALPEESDWGYLRSYSSHRTQIKFDAKSTGGSQVMTGDGGGTANPKRLKRDWMRVEQSIRTRLELKPRAGFVETFWVRKATELN